ncbi:MAG TPA: prepilin-type N-terminal cleavage/methylation domain-containing protein [Kofleriaceae bacterium]|jgi:prepilin-type N-terminal cleavage/methylation domain-containing protein|nr:prepilin-type N-terminal cleavage/methylation domain-containing protein [Kofleriaceae bacterium]
MREGERGFTLIELMIVVVLIGIVAAIAVPVFLGYTRKAKTGEPHETLQAIYRGAQTYYQKEHTPPGAMMALSNYLPAPSVGPTPALGTCCANGGKCAPNQAQWRSDPVWGPDGLDFQIDKAHYFSYSYIVSSNPGATDGSNSFSAVANADLDCNGVYSTYTLAGAVDERFGPGVSSSGTISEQKATE